MKWTDLVVLQKKVEVEKPTPLALKEWADGWLQAIPQLLGEGFYELGKGALMIQPFHDAPDWFNEGIHKMLGSQARQAWVYVAYHTGITNEALEGAFGDLNDPEWKFNINAQREFFVLVKDPASFCGAYRQVEGTEDQQYVRLMMKAVASRRASKITETMDKTRLTDIATSTKPRIETKKNYKAMSLWRNATYNPLFKDDATTTGPTLRPRQPTTGRIDASGDPSLGPSHNTTGLESQRPQVTPEPRPQIDPSVGPFEPPVPSSTPSWRHRNERGAFQLNFKRPKREPTEEYKESSSYGVIIGAIIVVAVAVYSQM